MVVVGVENTGWEAYGKATGLYNKHCKYSEQWNPWHPFQSVHDFQQAQSFSQQTKMWIDQHLRRGQDNFKIKSFQSADLLWKLLSQLDFGLDDDSWIEDHSHNFGTLYYRDIWNVYHSFWHISHFRCTWFLNQCASQTQKVAEYTVRWTRVIGGSMHKISFLPEGQLCQSFVHPRRLIWPIFWGISMPARSISQLGIFEKISAGHLQSTPRSSLGWSPVPQMVPKILMRHGIPRLELCCPHSGNLT